MFAEGPLGKAKLVLADLSTQAEPFRQAFNEMMVNVRNMVVQQRDAMESKLLA
jgi:hypothetical protein